MKALAALGAMAITFVLPWPFSPPAPNPGGVRAGQHQPGMVVTESEQAESTYHSTTPAGTVELPQDWGSGGRSSRRIPPNLRLTALGGHEHALIPKGDRGAVLLFIAHDCPISNRYAPEIGRIAAAYGPRKVAFYLVYAELDTPVETIRSHWKEYGFQIPGVYDSRLELARRAGVTVTPQAVMLDYHGGVVYSGRIDDRWIAYGQERARVTSHDLRDALDAFLAGRRPPHASTVPIGCFIPSPPANGR